MLKKNMIQHLLLKWSYQRKSKFSSINPLTFCPIFCCYSKIIYERIDNNSLVVQMLTREIAVSERKLQRRIKETTSKSPSQLIMFIRLNKTITVLLENNEIVAEMAFKLVFQVLHISQNVLKKNSEYYLRKCSIRNNSK